MVVRAECNRAFLCTGNNVLFTKAKKLLSSSWPEEQIAATSIKYLRMTSRNSDQPRTLNNPITAARDARSLSRSKAWKMWNECSKIILPRIWWQFFWNVKIHMCKIFEINYRLKIFHQPAVPKRLTAVILHSFLTLFKEKRLPHRSVWTWKLLTFQLCQHDSQTHVIVLVNKQTNILFNLLFSI